MDVTDVAEDGSVYAHVSNGKLMIYDISKNQLLLSLKEKPQTKSKTKVLKISSKNTAVAWLRSCSNQLSLLSVIHIHSKTTTNIKSFNDYPFEYILWHPHEDHLAVFSTFSIFTDVYSLEHDREECITSISGAKFDDHGRPIAQFSPDGEYFASVNVCNNGHAISVYCITNSSWIHIQRVLVTNCLDMGGMLWCQDSASLLVWQASAGLDLLLQLVTVDGRVEHTLHADAAPITSVCLSKCGRTAALHTSDARVRILDLLTWQFGSMGVLVHSPVIHESSARSRLRTTADHNQPICVCEPITSTLCELNHDASRTGCLRLLQFNSDARYLATYEPIFPNTLWLWDLVAKLPLDTVVKLADNVRVQGLRWHDDKDVLAATLSNNSVLVWTSQQTLIINQSDKLYPLTGETYLASLPQTATDEYCD